jgi:hypothetical protein
VASQPPAREDWLVDEGLEAFLLVVRQAYRYVDFDPPRMERVLARLQLAGLLQVLAIHEARR